MFKKINKYLVTLLITTLVLFSGCTNSEKSKSSKEPQNLKESQNLNESQDLKDEQHLKKSQEVFKTLQEGTDVENVMNIIKELTAEKYEGRLTCTKGNKLAGDYIASYFKKIGLEQMEGIEDYKDYYKQKTIVLFDKPLLQVKDKNNTIIKDFKFLEDFNYLPYPGTKINGEVISEFYYVESVDDFSANNNHMNNKILLIPQSLNIDSSSRQGIVNIMNTAINAKGVIFEIDIDSPEREIKHFTKSVYSPQNESYRNDGIVLLRCESEAFKELVNYSKKEVNNIYISADYAQKVDKVANIAGIIPGKDKELKDEYIVITAHFDHLGKNYNGTYNPGALDNASGVAIIMEIARVLKANNIELERSILFIAFNGEEEGLLGSQHFTQSYAQKLKNSVVINFDMVGHKNDNPIEFYYSNKNELVDDLKEISEDQDIKFIELKGPRSDHNPFQQHGIPAVTIIEWETDEYHYYKDTIDKLDKSDFKIVLNMIYTYLCNEGL